MADQSITQLPVAISVTGDEQTVIVQRGVTKQVQVSLIANAVSPGKLITNVVLNAQNYLVFYYSDGTTSTTGPIPGYTNATINGAGHLILTLTTGGTVDCGNVVGPQGPTGPTGPVGPAGASASVNAGSATTLPYGSTPTVTNTGTTQNAVFNFGIPAGQPGAGGATIANDNSTNAVRYPIFTDVTSGTLTTEYVSSSKLQFNPGAGTLTTPIVTATAGIGGGIF